MALGEIRLFAGNYAPQDWLFCDGKTYPASAYPQLAQLLGSTFGGNGTTTFAVPDLRSRVPIHQGAGTVLGDSGGSETVSLTAAQLPGHTHTVGAGGTATTSKPQTGYWAENGAAATAPYGPTQDGSVMSAQAVTIAGEGAPHENMQPFQALNYIVSAIDGEIGSEPYIAEVRVFAGPLPPAYWAICDGALLPLQTNTALGSLIGNTYGGDIKQYTIGLPNLLDRVAVGAGQGPGLTKWDLGATGGVNSVTLTLQQLAAHTHAPACNSGAGSSYKPDDAYWSQNPAPGSTYSPSGTDRMASGVFGSTGSGGAHDNRQPFVAMNYAISLAGLYPNRP